MRLGILIIICVSVSVLTSIITARILTIRALEIINDHVDKIEEITREFVVNATNSIEDLKRKL